MSAPAAPTRRARVLRTLRALVATPGNALVTALLIGCAILLLPRFWTWAVAGAVWTGTDRKACDAAPGACWIFIRARLDELLFGGFPPGTTWRPIGCAAALALLLLGAAWRANPLRRATVLSLVLAYPVAAFALLRGGFAGLDPVETRLWGGLLLNFVLTFIAILVSIPLGLLLAEGRRSAKPEIAWTATLFIEFWRAAPIVTILFFGVVILPLLLPRGAELSKFACVATALALFASAYMAEAIRGGLQAVPKGQAEAARALGLSPWRVRLLVVWPQALRVALPAIVNIGIDLFKDTSLVTIVGLFDVIGAAQQALKDPRWLGLAADAYAFVAALFFVLCSGLSWLSRRLEKELAMGRR